MLMNESRLSLQAETYEIQPINKKMTPHTHAYTYTHKKMTPHTHTHAVRKFKYNQNGNDEKKSTLKRMLRKE